MLTRELLEHGVRGGVLRPRFVDPRQPALLELAEDLVGVVALGAGETRGALEEALLARARSHPRPRVALGLVKLLLDRMTFEEPDEAAETLRQRVFAEAQEVRRALPRDASLEAGLAALAARLAAVTGRDLDLLRRDLYRDLGDERPLVSWDPLAAPALLDRYNLALAQGLLVYSRRVVLTVERAGTAEVRRLLRWLRFCRLVAEIRREGDAWSLAVEGPAALFDSGKKYGLMLATFLQAVPLLEAYRLDAEVTLPRRAPVNLQLTHLDPLVSPLAAGAGHVPEEIRRTLEGLEGGAWTVELSPEPRPVGATGLCVPDLALRHPGRGLEIAVELFHPWHRHALERRLAELSARPDPHLLLGVDRALAKDPEVARRLEGEAQVFLFNAFPGARVLLAALARFDA
jgi:predicted nuclease of restriction endonuclease-like RecB superfamily